VISPLLLTCQYHVRAGRVLVHVGGSGGAVAVGLGDEGQNRGDIGHILAHLSVNERGRVNEGK
jgi:hypothetical protein